MQIDKNYVPQNGDVFVLKATRLGSSQSPLHRIIYMIDDDPYSRESFGEAFVYLKQDYWCDSYVDILYNRNIHYIHDELPMDTMLRYVDNIGYEIVEIIPESEVKFDMVRL